ncbi:MAG: HNH endonuclease [Magnetospirillum sp.]|nr:HNH endonuclease [Magnetospirillum sp.]
MPKPPPLSRNDDGIAVRDTIFCSPWCEVKVTGAVQSYPALVLNADFRPLSYFPLSLWSWQEAVKAVVAERVNVVSEYDREVHSPTWSVKLPSVISLKEYIPAKRRPAFTRFNVFLRDRFSCQYCGHPYPTPDLTFDHVVPRSKGGRTTWANVVTACAPCNLRKGNRLPRQAGMLPLTAPAEPSSYQLQENGRAFPPNYLHRSWRDFLYWDSPLEAF